MSDNPFLVDLSVNAFHDLKNLFPASVHGDSPCIFAETSAILQTLSIKQTYFLDIAIYNEWKEWLLAAFSSVNTFQCSSKLLEVNGKELPWKESLRVLEIDSVRAPLQLGHLTGLKKLKIVESNWYTPDEYLSFFDQALGINLNSITFKITFGEVRKDVQDKFIRHFPFPVNFQKAEEE